MLRLRPWQAASWQTRETVPASAGPQMPLPPLTRWLPALFLPCPWPIASYKLPSLHHSTGRDYCISPAHREPSWATVRTQYLFIHLFIQQILRSSYCVVGTTVYARNHVRNQARKKTIRHWCPRNLTSQCEKPKRKQWRCTMSLGTSATEMVIFSRGGIEGNGGEVHVTAGQWSELDVRLGMARQIRVRGQWQVRKCCASPQTSCLGVLLKPPSPRDTSSDRPLHGHSSPHRLALHRAPAWL